MTFAELLPLPLNTRTSQAALADVTNGLKWDCAIGGIPFLLDIDENTPLRRESSPYQREQFDNAREAGEQSLSGWWLRSQSRFDGGAGIVYHEPLIDEGSTDRFHASVGVEVHDPEVAVKLCRRMDSLTSTIGEIIDMSVGPTSVYLLGTTAIGRLSSTGVVTILGATPSGATTIAASSADDYWVAASGGIRKNGSLVWTTAGVAPRVWWAKERLYAAQGNKVLQLSTAGGNMDAQTAIPVPIGVGEQWTWGGMSETSGAAWIFGTDGYGRSSVFAITVSDDVEDAVIVENITMPTGETINSILGYLSYLVLGTSRGLRVCNTLGIEAEIGALVGDDDPVHALAAYYDAIYGASTASHDGMSGFYRVDMSDERMPWVKDTYISTPDAPVGAAVLPGTDRLVLATESGVWLQSATDTVDYGWIETGWIRWGTLENKWYESVRVSSDTTDGSMQIFSRDRDGSYPLRTLKQSSVGDVAVVTQPSRPADMLALRFRLVSGDGEGPVLRGYQLRGMPVPQRQRRIDVPVICQDYQSDRNGAGYGKKGFGAARVLALESLEEGGSPVWWQDFRTGEQRRAIIDSIVHLNLQAPDREFTNAEGPTIVRLLTIDRATAGGAT